MNVTGKKMREKKTREKSALSGSYTIEAALIVPLLLAVILLFLQVVLYLHDTVAAEAWLYEETWKLRWNQEQDSNVFAAETAPTLPVLRYEEAETTSHWFQTRREVVFRVEQMPRFVDMIFDGQPGEVQKRSTETRYQPAWFLRITGAILDEWEE